MERITITRLSFGSIIKLTFFGFLTPIFLFGLVCGIAAFFGANTVMLNNVNVYGFSGLLTGIGVGILIPVVFSLLFSIIMYIGLWVYSKFSTMHISYKAD